MKIDNPLGSGSELTWPYRLQPHPDDPSRLGSQQILGKAMAPGGKWRRIGFGGPKGGGKSVAPQELIEMSSGSLKEMKDIRKGDCVLSFNQAGNIEPRRVTELFRSPEKQFYKVTTASGLEIECAETHKLKTETGWVRTDALEEGGIIAVARGGIFGTQKENLELLKLYALLLGDGSLHKKKNSVTIGSSYVEFQSEIQRLCRTLGCRYTSHEDNSTSHGRNRTAPVLYHIIYGVINDRITSDGLKVKSEFKYIPDWIKRQNRQGVLTFLRYLYATDGWVALDDARNEIGYATRSEALARDIMFLLRKFGINGRLQKRTSSRYEKEYGDLWNVIIKNQFHIQTFITEIGIFGTRHNDKLEAIAAEFDMDTARGGGEDCLPVEITKGLVGLDIPASKKDGTSSIKKRLRGKTSRDRVNRYTVEKFAEGRENAEDLYRFATNDIYWDKIASIEPTTRQRGYDFEVEGNHNYIAGGIVSHNSYGARAVAFGLTYRIPITIVIVRSRLTTLKRNHIIPAKNELREFLDRGIIDYNSQDKIFYMPSGGMVMFMHCARPADVDQFDGVSADVYVFEEAGHFTKEMMKGIYKNNRPSDIAINRNADYMPRVLFTFNWGGPGHNPLRRWFWDRQYGENERPQDYLFIFAPLDQNRALLDKDPTYKQTLLELPPQLREAYLHGDPDAFVGTMFTVVSEIHEVDPIKLLEPYNEGKDPEDYKIPFHWRLIGSLDAGVGAPCSFGLYAVTPKGKKYKIMQYYGDPGDSGSIKAPKHVDTIVDKIEACRWTDGRPPEFIVADSYAFQKHNAMDIEGGDITWEDLFAQYSLPLYQVKYNQITAIMGLHTALHFEYNESNTELEVEPPLRFFADACRATIEELRAAERAEHDPELIHKDSVDHAIDETKNFLLCAENPPDFVPVKKVSKRSPKADYGSRIDKLERMLGDRNRKETFRNAM